MSPTIMTVCGPIAPEQLGFTSMHEHILCDCTMFRGRVRDPRLLSERQSVCPEDLLTLENRSALRHNMILSPDNMRLDDEAVMTAEVMEFKDGGGASLVEVSVPGIRTSPEDVLGIRRIAEATGVNIVASTGLYAEYTWPEVYRSMTREQFISFLRREIAQGIGDTGILPGHIKAAYETPSRPLEAYLQAAASVSAATGLSLQVHLGSELSLDEIRQQVLSPLLRGGCIPERTILCHMQLLLGELLIAELANHPGKIPFDLRLHRDLLEKGFILSFTPFGLECDYETVGVANYPDWYSLSGLIALIKEGYAAQLVVGNDVFTKIATRRGGGEGYRRLHDFVAPVLRHCGVPEHAIRQIMLENPARILAY